MTSCCLVFLYHTPYRPALTLLHCRLYDEYAVADRLRMRGWVLPGAVWCG